MESKRQQKFAGVIQEDLAAIFQREGMNFLPNTLVTITKVRVTPDLAIARVFLSFFNNFIWTFLSDFHILNKTNFFWWMIRMIMFEKLLIIWILIIHKVFYLLWWWFNKYNNWSNLQDKLACVINWCDKSYTFFKKHYYSLYYSEKCDQIFIFWKLVNFQHLKSEFLNRKKICL